uniref:J domain-containing protein n=1 Tax=Alexandrium monilatum TaxID=311494 RepID=A0A7S4QD74_9DINO
MYRSAGAKAKAKAAPREPPAGGNALVTFDAQLATQQKKAEIEKHRGGPKEVAEYTGPKIKWEDTGLYKAMVRSSEIEEELTKIRNLIRKRTDPMYEPDDEDFNVAPVKKFNVKVDYYKLLDIDDFATARDIKGAYKKMALQYHPDKNRDKKPDELRAMQEEFEKIQEAYEVLGDRATRRQYDRAKFDEARAKSQGMNSSMYSQKTDTDGNFWGRWTGKKEKKTMTMEDLRALSKSQKVPKAPDLKVEVRLSLEKALRGGLKMREVRRDRMQRSFGGAQQNAHVFHVMVEPGQADGSEYRLEGDGNWTGVNALPGDLVFLFRHKPHAHLRQVPPAAEGGLEVSLPLRVRARAADRVLAAWTPTFKGQMALVRFLNPLLDFAPSKACSVTFRVEQEGLPLAEDKTRRGPLRLTVNVQLEGDTLVPCLEAACCRETLLRRYNRHFNHQPHLKVDFRAAGPSGRPVRHYLASSARERDGRQVWLPAVLTVWEAPPETDPVRFAKAASSLGFQAQRDPLRFLWGYHPGLWRRPLPRPRHFRLSDDELASDEESETGDARAPPPPALVAPRAEEPGSVGGRDAFDFDMLEEKLPVQEEGGEQQPSPRRKRPLSEKEEFLLQFNLGPIDGFPEPDSEEEGGPLAGAGAVHLAGTWTMLNLGTGERAQYVITHAPGSSAFTAVQDGHQQVTDGLIEGSSVSWSVGDAACRGRLEEGGQRILDLQVLWRGRSLGAFVGVRASDGAGAVPVARPARRKARPGDAQVELEEEDEEGEEERELTRLIRQKQTEMEQAKRKWSNRKQRIQGEREEEESTLRELLEKDKKREYERIEKEMNGLRSGFEFQITAEKKWMEEFTREVPFENEWVCVFKPSMVARRKPAEEAPISRRIMFDEVVKAKIKPTDDYWVQLQGSDDWCLIWHQKHGKLLQKWFGRNQQRFLDLDKKIEERRHVRNKTFLDYKRKRKEVSEWSIPPGPSAEERCEIEDAEGEHLCGLLEPILKELREHKARLRELRQKRLEAAGERAQRAAGGGSRLAGGQLPAGFRLEEAGEEAQAPGQQGQPPQQQQAAAAEPPPAEGWEAKKQAGDRAFKEKDWNTALACYSQALEAGGGDLESLQCATLLSNRALVHGKLFDWQKSLEDATDATIHETEWPKGWLRRATAELRLYKNREALASLTRGLQCAGKVASQFLPLITECEAALYSDRDVPGQRDDDPGTAAERIAKFRDEGSKAFEEGTLGVAVLCYTRALYHRSMMEGRDEAIVLSNRSAAFLKLGLPSEAAADALAASEKDDRWAKPLVRAGQAALLLDDFKAAYQYFARARRLEEHSQAASSGVNDCLQRIVRWEYTAATRRWGRFTVDRQRPREGLRVWALSDVFFDQLGVPEWCKGLSSSAFRDDVLMLAGNLADSLPNLRFALTVLKSKFRRVFFVPGNHDLWVRRATLQSMIKGERVKNEEREMVDSVSKLLEVLKVCDELGVETAPAEVAGGVFVVPMLSWYSRDFISREVRKQHASETDAEAKVTIDQWIKWPFPAGSDDAWKFFMRTNEAALRAVLLAKTAFERFSSVQAQVLTMTHFLTRAELSIDWTIPGIWDYIGCEGLDEQIRAIGSDLHVYGRACTGHPATTLEGVHYVHNYIGSTEKHRPSMAPFCIYNRGDVLPAVQPSTR